MTNMEAKETISFLDVAKAETGNFSTGNRILIVLPSYVIFNKITQLFLHSTSVEKDLETTGGAQRSFEDERWSDAQLRNIMSRVFLKKSHAMSLGKPENPLRYRFCTVPFDQLHQLYHSFKP